MTRHSHFWGACVLFALTACETADVALLEPELSFSGAECVQSPVISGAIALESGDKALKKMMKTRSLELKTEFNKGSPCMLSANGVNTPYAVFKLPSGIKGMVVSAGSIKDGNSIFASEVVVLDGMGASIKEFNRKSYRSLGAGRYGVQFNPADNARYVMIKADAELVGSKSTTQEVTASFRSVGGAYGSGTDVSGVTTTFDRTYSFDGEAGVRIVFPEQGDDN